MIDVTTRLPGSFRDPAGHIVLSHGIAYRRIEPAGRDAYERLVTSGLYEALVTEGLLVPHDDLGPLPEHPGAHTILRPEQVPMVSYPYEWCVSQLRDAALVTLHSQRVAMRHGMSLKDASAFNVQFIRGRPVLIDTLSFEPYLGGPWPAYRQFCQHFYAPLLLTGAIDARLGRLTQSFVDGVPLGLAARLLPLRSWLRPGPLLHIHLHAAAEKRWSKRAGARPANDGHDREDDDRHERADNRSDQLQPDRRSQRSAAAIVESLERAVSHITWIPRSAWTTYYDDRDSYAAAAFEHKSTVVARWLERIAPGVVWDLGANTGHFSRLAAERGARVVAIDADAASVELLYREVRRHNRTNILPLSIDLSSPSPAIGWANRERLTLEERGPADLAMALALIHHLAIGNNVPLPALAEYLARLGRRVILEFVPKSDPMVRQMLASREDVFAAYGRDHLERAVAPWFTIEERVAVSPSERTLYLLARR